MHRKGRKDGDGGRGEGGKEDRQKTQGVFYKRF